MANAGNRKGRKVLFEKGDDAFMDSWMMERENTVDILYSALSLTSNSNEHIEDRRRIAAIRFLWHPSVACPNFLRYAW